MKTKAYPQNADYETAKASAALKNLNDHAAEELAKMVGLREAKEMLNRDLDFYKAQRLFRDKGFLVGKYVGWTAPVVIQKFKDAKGSVLFIDEAYSLVDDRDGLFGDEAISAIVQEMESRREDTVGVLQIDRSNTKDPVSYLPYLYKLLV